MERDTAQSMLMDGDGWWRQTSTFAAKFFGPTAPVGVRASARRAVGRWVRHPAGGPIRNPLGLLDFAFLLTTTPHHTPHPCSKCRPSSAPTPRPHRVSISCSMSRCAIRGHLVETRYIELSAARWSLSFVTPSPPVKLAMSIATCAHPLPPDTSPSLHCAPGHPAIPNEQGS